MCKLNGFKIFLDDEREPSYVYQNEADWILVKTPEEAIEYLRTNNVSHISLDHDLGLTDERTGYTIILWIENEVAVNGFVPPIILIHTANNAAREKMEQGREKIKKLNELNNDDKKKEELC